MRRRQEFGCSIEEQITPYRKEKYTILESQIGRGNIQHGQESTCFLRRYKCVMKGDKSQKAAFVRIYNKREMNQYEERMGYPTSTIIQGVHHAVSILQTFWSSGSTRLVPCFISSSEDSDSIELITEYIDDSIEQMIERQDVYCEQDAVFLLKCLLISLHELHHVKNVFNKQECYLDYCLHPASLLFRPAEKSEDVPTAVFSNARNLHRFGNHPYEDDKKLMKLNEYSAPETLKYGRISSQSNLWSIGCIFYELLFGEKFIVIDSYQAATKEGASGLLEVMKYASETLRATLVCKDFVVSNFCIKTLQGLLAFNESDRYDWEDIKKSVFSLDLTQSIEDFDLRSIAHSSLSQNSLWASRMRDDPLFGQKLNTSQNEKEGGQSQIPDLVFMSFTEHENKINAVSSNESCKLDELANNFYLFQPDNGKKIQLDNSINKILSQDVYKNNATTIGINNEGANNASMSFLKESFMNVEIKIQKTAKSPTRLNLSQANHSGQVNESISDLFVPLADPSKGLLFEANKSFTISDLSHSHFSDSEVSDLFLQKKGNLLEVPETIQLLNNHPLLKSGLLYQSGNSMIQDDKNSVGFVNNQQILNTEDINKLEQQNQKQSSGLKINTEGLRQSIHTNPLVGFSENRSLINLIEQHNVKRQLKYSPLLSQYDSCTSNNGSASILNSAHEYYDDGDDYEDVRVNDQLTCISKSNQLGKIIEKASLQKTQKRNIQIDQQKQNIQSREDNERKDSTNQLSEQQFRTGSFPQGAFDHNPIASSIKAMNQIIPHNFIATDSNEVEEETQKELSQAYQQQNLQLFYSVYSNVSQAPIVSKALTKHNSWSTSQYSQQVTQGVNRQDKGEDQGTPSQQLREVHSKIINASDLKFLSQNRYISQLEKENGNHFEDEPIVGMDTTNEFEVDDSRLPNLVTVQHLFDELVPQSQLACSFLLNTKMQRKMGFKNVEDIDILFESPQQTQSNERRDQRETRTDHLNISCVSATTVTAYEEQTYGEDGKIAYIQKQERKNSLMIQHRPPPRSFIRPDVIQRNTYRNMKPEEDLFVFTSFLDPIEFKVQHYLQSVVSSIEDIYKHFNNEESINCAVILLSLMRLRAEYLLLYQFSVNRQTACLKQLHQVKLSCTTKNIQSVRKEKNVAALSEVIDQFLIRSSITKTSDLEEPGIYSVFRKHVFSLYNNLTKRIDESSREKCVELKDPYDRLIRMGRLAYHLLVISHYRLVFKIVIKDCIPTQRDLFSHIQEKIAFMDLSQLQTERRNLKDCLNLNNSFNDMQKAVQCLAPKS